MQAPIPEITRKRIPGTTGQSRQFLSYATDYFPPQNGDIWEPSPSDVNQDLVAASPDAEALYSAIWQSTTLSSIGGLLGNNQYQQRAAEMVQSVFTSASAMAPNMEFALVQPTTSLDDFEKNDEGFVVLNDIALVFNDVAQLGRSDVAQLEAWAQCASAWHLVACSCLRSLCLR